jgi:NAD(P)-dependent dehydrogenase (short-subunit alcohol dehydrogenase family)
MRIEGRNFVVTGGGNGIGREVVLALLQRGARVDAIDLRQEGLDEAVRLAGDGAEAFTGHALDVTDREAVAATATRIIEARSHVDGVINVAGIIQRFAPFSDLALEEMEKVMAVNFWGPVYLIRELLPHLAGQRMASLLR